MRIRNNTSALGVRRELGKTSRAAAKSLEKLSSGSRINCAADDASGLSVSERMRANITELDRAHSNAMEGLNLAKTADGALAEINDMLRRARELCVQAANGTYSQQELASISDEMNQLFDEIDRITEGSTFHEIQLFRGKSGPDFHYEYDEVFDPLDAGTEAWGEMDFVKTEGFDEPPVAAEATATFQLDDGIDFNDVSSLNGRTIAVGSYTYLFTDGTVNLPGGVYPIHLAGKTTESALEVFTSHVLKYSSHMVSSINIDHDTRAVTITAPLHTLDAGSFEADGMTLPNHAPEGDGTWANGLKAASTPPGSASLEQVDGDGIKNNPVTYSSTAAASFSLSRLGNALTQSNVDNLNGNSLIVGGTSVSLSGLASKDMPKSEFGTKLADKISKTVPNCTAVYDSTAQKINVTINGLSTATGYAGTIRESTTPSQSHRDEHKMFTSSALNLSVSQITPPSGERLEVCTVTIPPIPNGPFSFSLNGTNYLYYDSTKNPLKNPDDSDTMYFGNRVDISGKDQAWIKEDILSKISHLSGVGTVKLEGSKITVTAKSLNSPMNLNLKGTSITVQAYKNIVDKPGTSSVLGTYTSLQKTATVPFSLGGIQDIGKLIGSGFGIDGSKFEFTDGTSLHTEYTDIDLSGCTTFDQLKAKIQQVMGSTYTVDIDQTDPAGAKLLISKSVTSSIDITDGTTGIKGLISGGGAVIYADGANTGYSQKSIDFSSINSENLNDLLGKGFRINCATCKGEYINVFFCWENDGRAPESFEIEYDGQKRTIHNIAVELSKVTSGDQIVQSIVDQVRPTLTHFTDIEVGTPPTILIAKDKRIGGAHVGSSLQLGEVQTGLETNFTYSVNIRKVQDFPEDGSVAMKNNTVEIWVGSEPTPQIIPIHLPYLDLPTLRLRPPTAVNLNASEQDASQWLGRVDRANLAISEARGVIGADHNRLERAVQSLSGAHENLADAESRIRDTDMAEQLMEHVKHQILIQSQQSMLSQASSQPQQILQLLS